MGEVEKRRMGEMNIFCRLHDYKTARLKNYKT